MNNGAKWLPDAVKRLHTISDDDPSVAGALWRVQVRVPHDILVHVLTIRRVMHVRVRKVKLSCLTTINPQT